MENLPEGFRWDPDLTVGEETAALTRLVWPKYLIEPSDIPEPALQFEIEAIELARRFPLWGIRQTETGCLAAYLNGALIHADLSSNEFPDQGWSFAIEKAYSPEIPNCLCLLVANVDPPLRKLGLSQLLLEKAKEVTAALGYSTMIAPVRPTRKHEFPAMPMSEYLKKCAEDGGIFDPWLRTHARYGAEILNVCSRSVEVKATLAKWHAWLGVTLPRAGECELPGGLAPLQIENGIGIYRESNVWVRYRL